VNKERMLTILRAPHLTEKTAMSSHGYRQYAFKVLPSATKVEVREAVEQLFNVKVKSVTVCNMKGKQVRFGRRLGQRNDWKKAYITLEHDQEIDIAGQAG
jgi:large subunit ribosomal protein L23